MVDLYNRCLTYLSYFGKFAERIWYLLDYEFTVVGVGNFKLVEFMFGFGFIFIMVKMLIKVIV